MKLLTLALESRTFFEKTTQLAQFLILSVVKVWIFTVYNDPAAPTVVSQSQAERPEWVTALDGIFKTGRQDDDFVVLVRNF